MGVQRGRDPGQQGQGRGGEGAVSGQQLGETTSITAVGTSGKKETAPLPLELSVALPPLSLALRPVAGRPLSPSLWIQQGLGRRPGHCGGGAAVRMV